MLHLVCDCSSVDRVLASEAKGRGFDPRQSRQKNNPPTPEDVGGKLSRVDLLGEENIQENSV